MSSDLTHLLEIAQESTRKGCTYRFTFTRTAIVKSRQGLVLIVVILYLWIFSPRASTCPLLKDPLIWIFPLTVSDSLNHALSMEVCAK